MFRSLIWKQWRDNRWMILAIFLVYLAGVSAYLVVPKSWLAHSFFLVAVIGVSALFTAWSIHQIRDDMSLISTNALPIPPRRASLYSCVTGALSLGVPLFLAELLLIPFENQQRSYYLRIALHLYVGLFSPNVLLYAVVLFICARLRSWIGIFFIYTAARLHYLLSRPFSRTVQPLAGAPS